MKTIKSIKGSLLLALSLILLTGTIKAQEGNSFFDPEDLIAVNKWVMNGGVVKLPENSKFTETQYKTLKDSISEGTVGGFISFYIPSQKVKEVRDLVISARTVNAVRDLFTTKEIHQHVEYDNSRSEITVPTSFLFAFQDYAGNKGVKVLTISWVINTKDLP